MRSLSISALLPLIGSFAKTRPCAITGRTKTRPAQRLPPEILLHIFELLTESFDDYYALAFSQALHDPPKPCESTIVAELDAERMHLLTVTRVCRNWCSAGVRVLYSRPFLISPDRIIRFARTIASSPGLAIWTREMYVMDQDIDPMRWSRQTSRGRRPRFGQGRQTQDALAKIIRSCPRIQSFMSTSTPTFDSIIPFLGLQMGRPVVAGHLTRFMFCGTMATSADVSFLSSSLSLPALEVLCLRDANLTKDYPLPALPRLRMLQLSQCHIRPLDKSEDKVIHLTSIQYPSLVALELYGNSFAVSLEPELHGSLQQFYDMSSYHRSQIQEDTLPHTRIKRLALGPRYTDPSYPSSIPPLQGVETLTIALTFRSDEYHNRYIQELAKILSQAAADIEDRSLKKIVVYTSYYNDPTSRSVGMALPLEDVCVQNGIECCVLTEGLSSWIRSNLMFPLALPQSD